MMKQLKYGEWGKGEGRECSSGKVLQVTAAGEAFSYFRISGGSSPEPSEVSRFRNFMVISQLI